MKKSKTGNHRLWNSMHLTPPNLEFFKSKKRIGVIVRKAIAGECRVNKYRDVFFTEMVVLSRFMDNRKHKYRSDKGFRTIAKVNKVIERLHTVDLKSAVSVIRSNLTESYVPSKQLCLWILVKLQSNALLLQLLEQYCAYAARRLHHRLRTGHNWIEVTMALSMISRIWTLSKLLLKISLVSYRRLISIADSLKVGTEDRKWLKLKFPPNLKKWIRLNVPPCQSVNPGAVMSGQQQQQQLESQMQVSQQDFHHVT